MKISKSDIKNIVDQSKQIITVHTNVINSAKEAIRKSTINIHTAQAIIKSFGKK